MVDTIITKKLLISFCVIIAMHLNLSLSLYHDKVPCFIIKNLTLCLVAKCLFINNNIVLPTGFFTNSYLLGLIAKKPCYQRGSKRGREVSYYMWTNILLHVHSAVCLLSTQPCVFLTVCAFNPLYTRLYIYLTVYNCTQLWMHPIVWIIYCLKHIGPYKCCNYKAYKVVNILTNLFAGQLMWPARLNAKLAVKYIGAANLHAWWI